MNSRRLWSILSRSLCRVGWHDWQNWALFRRKTGKKGVSIFTGKEEDVTEMWERRECNSCEKRQERQAYLCVFTIT